MKSRRSTLNQKTYTARIQKGGRLVLPPDLAAYRLGQRVYFSIFRLEIHLSTKPRQVIHGRLLSSRVKRGVRTLAAYGPRAGASQS